MNKFETPTRVKFSVIREEMSQKAKYPLQRILQYSECDGSKGSVRILCNDNALIRLTIECEDAPDFSVDGDTTKLEEAPFKIEAQQVDFFGDVVRAQYLLRIDRRAMPKGHNPKSSTSPHFDFDLNFVLRAGWADSSGQDPGVGLRVRLMINYPS